jgi:putative flippase GtrA
MELKREICRGRVHVIRAPRYIGVGIFCVLLNNALLIGLDWLGVHYGISVLISAAVMLPLGFILQSRLTFGTQPGWRSFGRYSSVMIVNTPLAWLLLWATHDHAGWAMIYASPVTIGILFVWNYLASGWAIAARRTRVAQGPPLAG